MEEEKGNSNNIITLDITMILTTTTKQNIIRNMTGFLTFYVNERQHFPSWDSLPITFSGRTYKGDVFPSRFSCCVLLALSWNTSKNLSTDKLSRAIN